jgi:hypothetical protein
MSARRKLHCRCEVSWEHTSVERWCCCGDLHVDALTKPRNAGSLFCRAASSALGVICGPAAAAATAITVLMVAMPFILAIIGLLLSWTMLKDDLQRCEVSAREARRIYPVGMYLQLPRYLWSH